jgi:aminodeoxyfutalosine synthase
MEAMSAISVEEAQGILDSHDLIAIGARADEERRGRHGTRTTFLRVLEVHVDAVPLSLPTSIDAGEIRLTGRPQSVESAKASVDRARNLARTSPVSGFSLEDLWVLADGSAARLRETLGVLKASGLVSIADTPIDVMVDPVAAIGAAHDAGVQVHVLTVRELAADRRLEVVKRAREIQASVGGVQAFAPLARVVPAAQPSTGYDDVKQIALARLMVDNIDSIQVDWALYGPKLAQVALTMGADDIDNVSPLEGDLGRRRSPIEEIRGNIRAAGLEAVERDGRFGIRA